VISAVNTTSYWLSGLVKTLEFAVLLLTEQVGDDRRSCGIFELRGVFGVLPGDRRKPAGVLHGSERAE